eukprot:gnl/TRDRNA2_/TRDRNA2_44750_c0_seq1.p1 gnl/TRDRNA2_/TRDRNA2_44750_c0~~gnl/TRDRNA2_/TRDRNA2_44750_c0_seq1.p1  ORF type:complete len:258 (-),score=51.13 gnl/TRDRNA2_/TRDRNA2_44750_c0_seq1:276-1049(-)
MPNSSRALAERLLHEAGSGTVRACSKAMLLQSLLVAVGCVVLLSRVSFITRRDDQEPAVTMATHMQQLPGVVRRVQLFPAAQGRLMTRVGAESPGGSLKMPSPVLKLASAVVTPLLKGFYSAEAPLQAQATSVAAGGYEQVSKEARDEIDSTIKQNPCVIYSYNLSPFCSDAVALLQSTGATCKVVEPALEWFLMGAKGSCIREELGKMTGQTSFPHVFIGGESVGGLFSGGPKGDGIVGLAESGELQNMLKKAGAL